MSRYKSTFVRGVFIGCSAATLLLIASSLVGRGISLSFYDGERDSEVLAEGRSLLSLEGLLSTPGNDEVEVTTEGNSNYEKEPMTFTSREFTGEDQGLEQEPKKPLLTIVTTSRSLLERTLNRIRTSWGSVEAAEYRVVVGVEGTMLNDIPPQVVVSAHYNFPAFPYLSISNISTLLDIVTSNFINQYKWFLFAPSNVYISVQSLERFLEGLNPDKVVYIGRPSNDSMPQYCEGGPGIIFSHVALRKMKRLLKHCVRNSKGDSGYRELGKCFISELKTECSMGNVVSYLNLVQGFINRPPPSI